MMIKGFSQDWGQGQNIRRAVKAVNRDRLCDFEEGYCEATRLWEMVEGHRAFQV